MNYDIFLIYILIYSININYYKINIVFILLNKMYIIKYNIIKIGIFLKKVLNIV